MSPTPNNNHLYEGFSVPEGYFEHGKIKLEEMAAWHLEISAYPILASIPKPNGVQQAQTTPIDDLFDKTLLSDLYALKSKPVFDVPVDYFKQQASALKFDLSGELTGLTKSETIFSLPDNYFEKSAAILTQQVIKQSTGRVISLFKITSLAAAAVLVLVMSILGYKIYNQPVAEGDCGTIACLEKSEILKAKAIEAIDNESFYELVNPADLELRLNGTTDSQADSNSQLDALYEEELNS